MTAESERPVFFVHVPKTGGTSLAAYLDRHFHADECFLQISAGHAALDTLLASPTQNVLAPYALFEAHANVGAADRFGVPPFVVGLVRDPLDRVVSAYRHAKRSPHHPRHSVALSGLESFLTNYGDDAETSLFNAAFWHFATPAGELDLSSVDILGPTERLHDVCVLLAGIHGWRPPRLAASLRAMPERETITDPSVVESLLRHCAADFRLHATSRTQLSQQLEKLRSELSKEYSGESTYDLVFDKYCRSFVRNEVRISYDFKDRLLGDGWYHRESDNKGAYWRWTGPSDTASVDLPVRISGSTTVEVWILNPGSSEVFGAIKFGVNGQRFSHEVRHQAGHLVCSFECPATVAADGFAFSVEIETPVMHSMPLIDHATPALCGVAVSRIVVVPTESEGWDEMPSAIGPAHRSVAG